VTDIRLNDGLERQLDEARSIHTAEVSAPAELTFDRDAVHAHISMLHELAKNANVDGVLVLACYGENPDTGRKTPEQVQKFAIGNVEEMVEVIMAMEATPDLNVYAPWAVYRHGLAIKEAAKRMSSARLPLLLIATMTPARPVSFRSPPLM
jgi:hypothetical protein